MTVAAPKLDPVTTGGALAVAARRWGSREALVIDGTRLTYIGLLEEAARYARALIARGVKKDDHIALLMANCPDYIVLFHAIGLIGARALTLNARYREDDLRYVLARADADLLIIGGHALPHVDFRATLVAAFPDLAAWRRGEELKIERAPRLRAIFNLADPREEDWPTRDDLLAGADTVSEGDVEARAANVAGGDVALMMFSSGTTAHPKACMLTHESLARTGASLAERFRLTETDRIYNPLPFFHMSTMLPLAAARASGAALIAAQHFDAGPALGEIERERVTVTYASFPTMMSAIVAHADFPKRNLSSIRIIHCVGPADLLRRYSAAFPQAYLVNAYGLTEATGVPVYSDPDDPQEISILTSGRPFSGVEARIVDAETGSVLPPNASGEIQLRGSCVFAGYYKDADANARVLIEDGWLRTGDIGAIDEDGRVIYQGRIKDMLKIGGENVAAVEIESFLCTHPDVLIAQAIPVPDEHLFEVAAVFVELRDGAPLTEEDVVRHCIGRIASFKIPRYVRFVRDWPMSATKIQKFQLQKDFAAVGKIDVKKMIEEARREAASRGGNQ